MKNLNNRQSGYQKLLRLKRNAVLTCAVIGFFAFMSAFALTFLALADILSQPVGLASAYVCFALGLQLQLIAFMFRLKQRR